VFGWITRAWHWAVGNVGGPVVGWVRDLIHGVFGFLHTIFGHVIDAWPDMWHAARNLWHELDSFGRWAGHALWHLFRVWIPGIIRWAKRELLKAWHDLMSVYHWAIREFDRLKHWVAQLIDAVRSWIINDIWRPLSRSLVAVWHWLRHEGSILWFYITHPGKLVDLIWEALILKLEQDAWKTTSLLGGFFLGLFVHNMKRVALLLEDMINAVL